MNDITYQLFLVIMIQFGFLVKVVDIKTAFLSREFEEKIYVEFSLGKRDDGKDDCIILRKSIYGLVQVLKQYTEKAVEILRMIDFNGGNVDQCSTQRERYCICSIVHR